MSIEFDSIEKFTDGTVIQHGDTNNRVYLMKKGDAPASDLVVRLKQVAVHNGYTKVFAKVSGNDLPVFMDDGFVVEGYVANYFEGEDDLFLMGFYLTESRNREDRISDFNDVLDLSRSKAQDWNPPDIPMQMSVRRCDSDDIPEMVSLYREVFPSYPFPIHDPDYLTETMEAHVDYYCIERDGRLIALSSAEIDYDAKSAEMTDFATLPEHRGQGSANWLLSMMEKETVEKGIMTFYTIARAISPGMNITFARENYCYGGRLKNNTHISGRIESMNVWYKNVCEENCQ